MKDQYDAGAVVLLNAFSPGHFVCMSVNACEGLFYHIRIVSFGSEGDQRVLHLKHSHSRSYPDMI